MAKKKKSNIFNAIEQAAKTTRKTSKKAISQGRGTRSTRTSSGGGNRNSRYQEGQYGQLLKNSRLQRNKSASQIEQEKKECNERTKQRINQNKAYQQKNKNRTASTYGELNKRTQQIDLTNTKASRGASRLKDATKGTLQQIKGSHQTTFYAIRNPNENKYINAEEYKKSKGEKNVSKFTEGQYGQLLKKERSGNKKQREKDLKKASKTIEKGTKNLEKAKKGLGRGGEFAVDAYSALLGVGADMITGPASMGTMASRSFGGAYDQAKREGADDSQAALYGFSQAAVETATEKMFAVATPLRKIYGKGAGDELSEKLLNKIVSKTKTKAGKEASYNGSKVMMSALTEGLEEMVAEGIEPAIANAIYAEATGNPHSTSASDVLRAGALGGAMGGIMGGAGQVVDSNRGRNISDNAENIFGEGGVMELVRKGLEADEDAGTQRRAAAYKEMIETGNGIANAQVAELAREVGIQQVKDEQSYDIATRSADSIIKENGYIPVTMTSVDDNGNPSVVLRENTQRAFDARKTENVNAINEYTGEDLQLPENQVDAIADSIAAIQTGVAGINDVSLFTITNPEAREMYMYITNDTLPRTNKETKQHLFEKIAQNRVDSAQAETEMFKDGVSGLLQQDMAQDYSQNGQEAFAKIADNVGITDPVQMNYAIATFDDFYNAGRGDIAYEEISQVGNPTYTALPVQYRRSAYEAGLRDRQLEQDTISGMEVRIGETRKELRLKRNTGSHRGRLISELSNETRKTLTASEQRFMRQMARVFNINIHVTEDANMNGAYVDGDMYISINADRALPYVFAHEITHHMQEYAPQEYLAFKNLIRDSWTREGGISEAIRAKQEHYKKYGKKLTQDQALDEIVADSTYEMLQDENFAEEICRSNKNIAQAILDAIKNVLEKIRTLVADGDRFIPKQNADLLSNLDILKEAEKLWTDGLAKASGNRNVVSAETSVQSRQRVQPFDITRSEVLKNMKTVTEMSPVVTLDGSGFPKKEGRTLSQAVIDYYGGKEFYVKNPTLGEVKVGKRGIKAGVQHKLYGLKIEGFKGLREVIHNGFIVNVTQDYKNDGTDRVILAAPIKIKDEAYYMGVVINRTKSNDIQNYYIHDVILEEKNNTPKDTDTDNRHGRVDVVSPYTILQQLNNINNLSEKDIISDEGKFSLKEDDNGTQYTLPDEEAVTDYMNEHDTEFVDVPPVKDYAKSAASKKAKSIEELQAQVEQLKEDKKLTHGRILDRKSVREQVNAFVRTLMMRSESYTPEGKPRKVKASVVNAIVDNIARIYTAIKDGDYAQASIMAYESARETVEGIDIVDDAMFETYKDLRDYLKNTKIQISESDSHNIPDFAEFKRQQRGKIRIVKEDGIPVDVAYEEFTEKYPELFGSDAEHPADQLMRMADVRDSLEPYDIMLSEDATQALIKFAAQDILNIAATGRPWRSFADRKREVYDESLKRLKARHAEAMRDLKIEERERATRMVNREKTKAKEKAEKQKYSKEHAKRFGNIYKNYKWLSDRLVKPTDDKHIPEEFRASLAHLLQQMDFQTERSKKLEAKYGKAQKTIKMEELRRKYAEIAKEDGSGIFEYDGYIFELMDALCIKLEGKTVDSMTNTELAEVDAILKAITHNIRNYNNAFAEGINERISGIAEEAISAARTRLGRLKDGKHYDRTGIIGGIDSMLNESMVTPRDFFERLGGGMNKAFLSMRKGFDKHVKNIDKTRKFFDEIFKPYVKKTKIMHRSRPGSELEKWRDNSMTQEFSVEGGTIRLNPAQIMSLYCLMKREQAIGHILGSGIVSSRVMRAASKKAKVKKAIGAKVETNTLTVKVSYSDVMGIIDSLTDEQRQMADDIQGYLNNECAEWGNETSMRLYGYKKFTENNYFPIKSSDAYLDKEGDARTPDERIKNFGFTKGTTVNASNPIIIDDIFTVAAEHINKMSLYNAFAAPISDFMRVYNYKVRDEKGEIIDSVQSELGTAYGKKAISYINTFLADLNNQANIRPEGFSRFITKSLANYKKAAIGGNLRVALQQPTAIMRAFTLMSPKYFAGNINVRKNLKDMKEHCPVALWKSWGFSQVDMARDMDDIMMNNEWSRIDAVTMEIYGALDNVTWSFIWGAVRKEIADKYPNIKVDSPEFYALCNERAAEVFEKTQVVDSVFNRSEIMRNTDAMSKVVTSFMAEPTRTFNMLRTEYAKAADLWREGRKGEAVRKMNRTTSVFVLNAAAVSAAAAIADALRDKAPGDDDDDTSWYANFLSNFMDNINPVNMIPVANDIWGVKDGWSITNMALSGYESLVKGVMAFVSDPTFENAQEVANGIGYVTGIPIKNIQREMDSIFKALGINVFASDGSSETSGEESLADKLLSTLKEKFGFDESDNTGASGYDKGDEDYYGIYADSGESILDKIKNKTNAERKKELREKRVEEILSDVEGMSGSEREDAIWDTVTKNYTKYIENGDLDTLKEMRATLEAAGGDVDKFDESVQSKVKTAYKKTIGENAENADLRGEYRDYLLSTGYTEEQISQEIVAKSDTAKAFQIALCTGDEEAEYLSLAYLLSAGIHDADIQALYQNRNRAIDADDYSTGEFAIPLNGRISSEFGYRDPVTGSDSGNHKGIDIAAAEGTDIVAADGGKVVKVAYDNARGYYVDISHGNGRTTRYQHLSGYYVQKGDAISKGQIIAAVGSTGDVTGPHLHFEVRENGTPVDPMIYFR